MKIHRLYLRLIEKLVEELKENLDLVSVVLYGSVARGNAKKDSDIDLLVIAKNLPREKIKRQKIFSKIEEKIEPEMKKLYAQGYYPTFSPILRTKNEAKHLSPLYLDMIEDAKILYDKDNFFSLVLERLRKRLKELHAKRKFIGKKWYWDLKPDYKFGEIVLIE
jgi:predicted nucleotidyltransferase